MRKILLVSPNDNPEQIKVSIYSKLTSLGFLAKKVFMTPLDLATVAALTPDDVEVDMWDEAVRGHVTDSTDFKTDYDLVGVTGYFNHLDRVTEIGHVFRRRGIPVVVGGPGVSAAPEHYRDKFDVVFIGEAEYIWPQFVTDWKAGSYRPGYRQVTKVDIAQSPLPHWDKLAADIKYYITGGVQTTRGCPFDCEFCDVIYLFGRVQRHKSIEQVLAEVCALERLGVEHIFFCDDNFYGSPRYYKSLLKELIPLNRSFRRPLGFFTQIDLRVAKDDEMLALLADANFIGILIGIESPNIESLIETNKPQNYKTDIVEDVKKIHSYGLQIQGSMIVGFDHDDASIFENQFQFIQEACLPVPRLNTLKAPPGTKLWVRLAKEGRVLSLPYALARAEVTTNIIPKRMTRVELLSGYCDLTERVRDWHNFEMRTKGMMARVQRQPNVKQRRLSWKLLLKFLRFVLFHMDKEARRTTLQLLLYTRRRAGFMTSTVAALILAQWAEVSRLPFLREAVDSQIRQETMGKLNLQAMQPLFFVPDTFKKPYKAIFPELHERVYRGLASKSRTHDALVEVIYDFLTRWGPTFQQFEEYHRTFLHEICDRTIVKENGNVQRPISPVSGESVVAGKIAAAREVPDIRRSQLADEVLRSVEQELRCFRAPPGPVLEDAVTG